MLYSAAWLQEYSSTKLPTPDKLEQLISLHAFEVEEVKKHKKDTVFDIDVLPNRAHDCLNHIGIAREIAAITGKKVKFPKIKAIKVQKGTLKPLKVHVESFDLVPRYKALVIEGIKLGKSPKKVQEYLAAVGVNSINNIVDLTNFIMLEMGQPLHAFDYDTIQGSQMTVRAARNGEKLETLDDQELLLPEGIIVIEDAHRLIDLAGIKGGKNSGISNSTKNIVLQAANFNPTAIYKAKKALKYTTQAADIYSHGIDLNLAVDALTRANQLLQEWGIGGKVVQIIFQDPQKTPKVLPKHIELDVSFVEYMLGVSIPKSKIEQILQSLDCRVTKKGSMLIVQVPTRRLDLEIPEDLVEEIGRIYGYENIPSEFPAASLIPPKKNYSVYWRNTIRDILQHLGFNEMYNYSFIGEKDVQQFAYTLPEKQNLITPENPISEDFAYLRDSLLEHLLINIQSNQKKFRAIRIFEIGKIFSKKNKKFEETEMLGMVLYNETFYSAKGVVDLLLQSLGINDIWYDTYKADPEKSRTALWHSGKSAEIKVGSGVNREIGFIGEISSGITTNLKIQEPIVAIHLNLAMLMQLASDEKEYQPTSKYPAVTRDIAILVSSKTKVVDVMNTINAVGKELIRDIDLFDMYEGENLADGRKSLAFHIIYQANDKTLENKDVDIVHNEIIKTIEENPAWQVRK